MSDPARLLQTNLDSTFRRALDAAIAAEPPQGEQSKIWQSLALALPSGVLLGATTSANAAAMSGATTSANAAALNGAASSAAIGSSLNGAASSAAIGSSLNGAAVGGIASTSVSATAGAVGGGLGLVAAKAVAVGLGLGFLVNTTVVSVPKLLHVSSAKSAQVVHVAPVPQASPQRTKPRPRANAPLAVDPALAPLPPAMSTTDTLPAEPPSGDSTPEIRTLSGSATSSSASSLAAHSTSSSASATPRVASDPLRLENEPGDAKNGAGANGAGADVAATDGSSPSADELRDESRLLARARQALNASNSGLALELILEHRRDFPAGRLVQERDALEVQALQRNARYSEARARARAFLVHFPMSPHREKMRAIAE